MLSSFNVSSGDVIDCNATAIDGTGVDTATTSHIVTNTVPVINNVTISPSAIAGQDDLTCNVSTSDVDGDALLYTYEWFDSSGLQQTTTLVGGTSDVLLGSGLSEDTWTCEVTPFDGTDYGIAVSDSANVVSGCSSLEFDGTSYVDTPFDYTVMSGLTQFSTFWIKPYTTSAEGIMGPCALGIVNSTSVCIRCDNNELYFLGQGWKVPTIPTLEVIRIRGLVVFVFASSQKIFVNGTLVDSSNEPFVSLSEQAYPVPNLRLVRK